MKNGKGIYSLYKTTNLINNKIYYGVHKETKWTKNFIPENDGYLGSGLSLKRSINKHGKENFKREVLCVSNDPDYIYFLESRLVTKDFINEDSNYNIVGGGLGPTSFTKEECSRRSIRMSGTNNHNCGKPGAMLGKKHSTEALLKISRAHKGKTISEEQRMKISKANIGKKHSEETRKKMSDAHKNPSSETRRKMSIASGKRTHSLETKKKISRIQKGKIVSTDTWEKLSRARKGKVHSAETRKKISEIRKKHWEERRRG